MRRPAVRYRCFAATLDCFGRVASGRCRKGFEGKGKGAEELGGRLQHVGDTAQVVAVLKECDWQKNVRTVAQKKRLCPSRKLLWFFPENTHLPTKPFAIGTETHLSPNPVHARESFCFHRFTILPKAPCSKNPLAACAEGEVSFSVFRRRRFDAALHSRRTISGDAAGSYDTRQPITQRLLLKVGLLLLFFNLLFDVLVAVLYEVFHILQLVVRLS